MVELEEVGLAAEALDDGAVEDLREADHRDLVLLRDLAVVELAQEARHLVGPADLGIVVLDLARRELAEGLHLDLVDDGLEDALARAEADAAEHLHDHALLVLARLVTETNRRRLATT